MFSSPLLPTVDSIDWTLMRFLISIKSTDQYSQFTFTLRVEESNFIADFLREYVVRWMKFGVSLTSWLYFLRLVSIFEFRTENSKSLSVFCQY